jgi:hypothetical protein
MSLGLFKLGTGCEGGGGGKKELFNAGRIHSRPLIITQTCEVEALPKSKR